jgi:hypothetical protein
MNESVTSFAIYEFIGLLLALPLSYLFAWIVRRDRPRTYKDELQRMFHVQWNGEPEDEYYAWLRVRMFFPDNPKNEKKLRYIDKQIRGLSRYRLYSETMISREGELLQSEELPADKSDQKKR